MMRSLGSAPANRRVTATSRALRKSPSLGGNQITCTRYCVSDPARPTVPICLSSPGMTASRSERSTLFPHSNASRG